MHDRGDLRGRDRRSERVRVEPLGRGAGPGLTPTGYQSGEIDLRGRISRRGDTVLRSYLYEAAAHVLTRSRADTDLRRWGLRLRKRIGFRRAVVATARKLSVILHAMWRKGAPFQAEPGAGMAAAGLAQAGRHRTPFQQGGSPRHRSSATAPPPPRRWARPSGRRAGPSRYLRSGPEGTALRDRVRPPSNTIMRRSTCLTAKTTPNPAAASTHHSLRQRVGLSLKSATLDRALVQVCRARPSYPICLARSMGDF